MIWFGIDSLFDDENLLKKPLLNPVVELIKLYLLESANLLIVDEDCNSLVLNVLESNDEVCSTQRSYFQL